MRYPDAAKKYLNFNYSLGNDTVGLAVLIEARALDQLDGGKLDCNSSGQMTFGGKPLVGAGMSVPPLMNAPGFLVRPMITDGSVSFVVPTKGYRSALVTNFKASDIAGDLGSANVAFVAQLQGLLAKVRDSGLVPPVEVQRAIDVAAVGLVVCPAAPAALRNYYKGLDEGLLAPVFPAEIKTRCDTAWATTCAAFDDARKAYFARAFADASRLASASASNAELWDKVYASVKAIRDLPSTVAVAAAGAVVDTVTGNLGNLFGSAKVWILLGGAAVIALGVFTARRKGISFVTGK